MKANGRRNGESINQKLVNGFEEIRQSSKQNESRLNEKNAKTIIYTSPSFFPTDPMNIAIKKKTPLQ